VSERRNGVFLSAIPGGNLDQREKPSMNTKLAIRVGTNPGHHLWKNRIQNKPKSNLKMIWKGFRQPDFV